jgi:ribose 5-phosphate isomerase B
MKIYLGADHGGFKLKEEVKHWLEGWGFEYEDMGAFNYTQDDDYPDYAWPVAMKVGIQDDEAMGILICRSGQGECIVANKAKGARAALAWNEETAHAARNDDDANILCLAADYTTVETAKKIIHMFLNTPFDDSQERFIRRVNKVRKIDINL